VVADGYYVSAAVLAALSPYQISYVNRFGLSQLQLDRHPEPIEYELPLSVMHSSLSRDSTTL